MISHMSHLRISVIVGEPAEKVSSAQVDILAAKVEDFGKAHVACVVLVERIRKLSAKTEMNETNPIPST